MTGWHGKQKKGAKAERRAVKRVEAEARNALTKPERRRAYRREQSLVGPAVDIRGTGEARTHARALGRLLELVPDDILTDEIGSVNP